MEEDDDDEYDDDDNFVEVVAREYRRENVGPVASPYLMPYFYKRRFHDTKYGVRKDGDIYMKGDFPILVDTDGDITIKDRVFKRSKGLRELFLDFAKLRAAELAETKTKKGKPQSLGCTKAWL